MWVPSVADPIHVAAVPVAARRRRRRSASTPTRSSPRSATRRDEIAALWDAAAVSDRLASMIDPADAGDRRRRAAEPAADRGRARRRHRARRHDGRGRARRGRRAAPATHLLDARTGLRVLRVTEWHYADAAALLADASRHRAARRRGVAVWAATRRSVCSRELAGAIQRGEHDVGDPLRRRGRAHRRARGKVGRRCRLDPGHDHRCRRHLDRHPPPRRVGDRAAQREGVLPAPRHRNAGRATARPSPSTPRASGACGATTPRSRRRTRTRGHPAPARPKRSPPSPTTTG